MSISEHPTKTGIFALLIWSFSALFASQLTTIPTFEMLTIVFIVSSLTIFLKVWFYGEWFKFKQPWFLYLIGIIGIYGNDLFYFEAFKYAPAAHVDLINFLWPIFVIMFATFLPRESVSWQQVLGCFISFFGIYLLLGKGKLTDISYHYLKGYGYALADALVWAFYILMSHRYRGTEKYSESIGLICLVCSVLSLCGHLNSETFVVPSFVDLIIMLVLGVFSQGLAYVLWEQSIKNGDYRLLSNLAYITPILSVLVLILFKKAHFSYSLLFACVLVTLGAFIANNLPKKWIFIISLKTWRKNVPASMPLLSKK